MASLVLWWFRIRRHFLAWFVTAVLLYALLSILLASNPWVSSARFFPLLVVPLGLVLVLIELFTSYVPLLRKYANSSRMMDLGVDSGLSEATVRRQELGAWGWIAFLFVGILIIGFPVTVFVFMLAYLRLKAGAGWLAALTYTLLLWIFIFVVLQRVMHIPWPDPLLRQWLGW